MDQLIATVEKACAKRNAARAKKNYAVADELRDMLTDMGVVIQDTSPTTSSWTWSKAAQLEGTSSEEEEAQPEDEESESGEDDDEEEEDEARVLERARRIFDDRARTFFVQEEHELSWTRLAEFVVPWMPRPALAAISSTEQFPLFMLMPSSPVSMIESESWTSVHESPWI